MEKKQTETVMDMTEHASEEQVCPGCCHKTKVRSEKEYKDLLNRLRSGARNPPNGGK